MATSEQRSADLLATRRLRSRQVVAGVDGGGTKTHAVLVDQDDRILGEGLAGPSNPLRVGITMAAAAVRESLDRAGAAAGVRKTDIVAGANCAARRAPQESAVGLAAEPTQPALS